MEIIKKLFAQKLLEVKAVKLQPQEPFTWASGWKSPIYTDNRKTLSFPRLRSFVKLELCHLIQQHFPEAEAVAGVATGAIAQGALVAEELALPYCYVRPKPKDHGMGNQVEGELKKGAKVVVVEDLISTGGSSLKAVEALRQYGVEVVGMVASFTYGFPVAEEAFSQAGVTLYTLSDYEHVIAEAAKTGYISPDDQPVLAEWRKNPSEWNK
jgi:orotate phosphoribosyltransferase